MVRCQGTEPKIETFTRPAAAELLGVEQCTRMAARYTLTGAPRFFREDCPTTDNSSSISRQLMDLEAAVSGSPKVKISLVHALRAKDTEDPKLTSVYGTLEDYTEPGVVTQ